jgi:hypothetical protein
MFNYLVLTKTEDMRVNHLIAALGIAVILLSCISCEKENIEEKLIKEKISGVVQKGPFINGTQILMSELDINLAQTGKIFSSQISDDNGLFELNNIELSSNYVEFSANGYYFDEVEGNLSSGQHNIVRII